ncbi:hypothetical protein [Nocardioides sp. GCM10027113]|uniref:hypothetical protein n=1 Tax=unclassified Nocardioides TaxID=2615069 RepID=UPI003605D0E2
MSMPSRRSVARVLVPLTGVLAAVAVPVVAGAAFTSQGRQDMSVATAQMQAPTAVTGTWRCRSASQNRERFEVTVTGFTDTGPVGATYRYSIARAATTVATQTSTAKSISFDSGDLTDDGTATVWTLSIQSTLAAWTGPLYTRAVTCPKTGTPNGTL